MGLRLGTLLFAIFFLIGFLILSFIHYDRKFNQKYTIRNRFPYELNYDSSYDRNTPGNLCLCLMSASLITFFCTFAVGELFTRYIAITIIGVLFAICLLFICLVPLTELRKHLLFTALEFAFGIFLPATIGILAIRDYQQFDGGYTAMIATVGSFFVAFIVLLLTLNPKLSIQIKMDKKINKDGSEEYVRPKSIALAYSQWLLIFSIFIDAILIFILMLA